MGPVSPLGSEKVSQPHVLACPPPPEARSPCQAVPGTQPQQHPQRCLHPPPALRQASVKALTDHEPLGAWGSSVADAERRQRQTLNRIPLSRCPRASNVQLSLSSASVRPSGSADASAGALGPATRARGNPHQSQQTQCPPSQPCLAHQQDYPNPQINGWHTGFP